MRYGRPRLLVAAALIAGAVLGAGCGSDDNAAGPAITGTVLDSAGQPVAGAGVLIEYTFGNEPRAQALGDKPRTHIEFQLPEPGRVRIWITGPCRGRTVRALLDGDSPAGSSAVIWTGTNDAGQIVPAGMYTANVQTPRGRTESPLYWPGGWPPAPPLESREWLAMTDATGRFAIPLACQPFGESMTQTDEIGTPIGTVTIQYEARVWAVHNDLGAASTGFVPVDPELGTQVEVRYLGKGD